MVRDFPRFVDGKVRQFVTKLHNYNEHTMAYIEKPPEMMSFTHYYETSGNFLWKQY